MGYQVWSRFIYTLGKICQPSKYCQIVVINLAKDEVLIEIKEARI